MTPSSECSLKDLNAKIGADIDVFISSASFEQRSLSIIKSLEVGNYKKCFIACNKNNSYNHENLQIALQILNDKKANFLEIEIDSNNPIKTTDAFVFSLNSLDSGQEIKCIAIDITTFTRESLSILLRVIFARFGESISIKYLYNPANNYGIDGKCWLSRGVRTIRSVIGFSGFIIPSRTNHLILLPGYEFERASEIIANYEPNFLSLGIVPESENFSADFYVRQRDFVDRILGFYSVGAVSTFEFSARDALRTKHAILRAVDVHSDSNVIVIPLNAKPSVIGATLACLTNRAIQMGYAKPERYNTDDYSVPSERATVVAIRGFGS